MYYAEVKKTLNTDKLKPGDPVEFSLLQATLLNGKVVAPANARLHGKVLQARAADRAAKQDSLLSILVDTITWKENSVPICASISGFGTREFKFTGDPWPMQPKPTPWIEQQSRAEMAAGARMLADVQNGSLLASPSTGSDLFREPDTNVVNAGNGFLKEIRLTRDSISPSVLARKDKNIKLMGGTLVALEELSPAGNACRAAVPQ
jgi:hypothetical protein